LLIRNIRQHQVMQSSCQRCGAPFTVACLSRFFAASRARCRDDGGCPNQPAIAPSGRAASNRHVLGELRSKPAGITASMTDACGDNELTYRMIAERDNETVKIERTSSFVIVAKARIWASEGWRVVITDTDGKSYAPEEFDQLLAA
jgi:hypothetical protein